MNKELERRSVKRFCFRFRSLVYTDYHLCSHLSFLFIAKSDIKKILIMIIFLSCLLFSSSLLILKTTTKENLQWKKKNVVRARAHKMSHHHHHLLLLLLLLFFVSLFKTRCYISLIDPYIDRNVFNYYYYCY